MITLHVKELATEKGMLIKNVMEAAGYQSQPSFSYQINNADKLSMKTIIRIAEAIGCEVWELFAPNEVRESVRSGNEITITCPHCGKSFPININIEPK